MNIVRKIHDLFRVKTVAGAQLETPEAVSSLGAGGSTFITITGGGGTSLNGSGLSEEDRVKLDSIELGALVNLDAFSKIQFNATNINGNNLSSSSNSSIIANVPTDTANIKIVGNYPITVNLESVSLFNSNTSTTTGTTITTYNISFNSSNNIVIEYVDGTLLNVADVELIQVKHKEDVLATYLLSDITYTTSEGTITSFTIPYSNTDFSEIEFCKYETVTTETEEGSTTVRELRVLSTLPASPTKQSIITLNSLTDSFWNYEEDENGNKFVWTDYNVYSTKDVSAYGRGTDLGDTYASNLYELKDVVLTNLSNNDLLIYNSSTSKWVNINKDLLGISADLLHTLTISVNGVTQATYNPASADSSVNISTITLNEVTEYIDLKIDTKLDVSEFFKWFTINYDSNNNVVSIQANFDFYSIGGVSAYGLGEGEEEPSYVSELGLLSDVTLTNVALNNILLYDGNKWVNKPMSSIIVDAYTKSEIDTKLSSISSEISTLKSNVTSILSNITGVQGDITNILNSISGITSDISTINATISDILTTLTGKLDKDDFFTWFTIIKNTSGKVVSILANFDFYSIGEVSAYGLGDIGGNSRTTLATLDDVSLSNLITNDMLAYNGSKWVNIPMSQVRGVTSWVDLENKPTTLSGFGITDAYTTSLVDSKIAVVSNKLDDFLTGSDADTIINKWKELESFLSGYTQTQTLADLLSIKADKSTLDNYLPLSGGTMTGVITAATTAGTNGGILLGTTYLNAISGSTIFYKNNAIRFGTSDTWSYNSWAGLKYNSSNKTIYLGLPDNNIIAGNVVSGVIKTPSVTDIYVGFTNYVYHLGNLSGDNTWITLSDNTISHKTIHSNNIVLDASNGQFVIGYTVDKAGHVVSISQRALNASDIPNIDWSKITSGKPTTLAGYGITDGVNTVTIAGTGNAITTATITGHALTLTKGNTFLQQSTFDDLFEKVNIGTTTSPVYAIKAKYHFYSVGEVSAYEFGEASGGGARTLAELADVLLTSLSSDQILKYNGSKWVNVPITEVKGATSWDEIEDKPTTFTPSAHTHTVADITDISTKYVSISTTLTVSGLKTFTSTVKYKPTYYSYNAEDIEYRTTSGTLFGGIGAVHNGSSISYFYIGKGSTPWDTKNGLTIGDELGFKGYTVWHSGNTIIPTVPTKLSAFKNDSGYISGITKAMVEGVLTGNITSHTHSYLPLSGGTISGTLNAPQFSAQSGGIYTNYRLYLPESASSMSSTTRPRFGRFDRTAGTAVLQLGASNLFDIVESAGSISLLRVSSNEFTYKNTSISLDGHTHSYLPLAGGTMTGAISFQSSHAKLAFGSLSTSPITGYKAPKLSSNGVGIYSHYGGSSDEGAIIITEDTCVIYNSADTGWNFQVMDKDLGTDMTNDATRSFGVNDKHQAFSLGGFVKSGSSDSYVLLGGGGHKTEASLSVASASSATKLTSSAGSATLPIYFSDGKPVACTASSVFSNLSNSGNSLSVTVAGQNRTLTVNYASNAGNADTVDNEHASAFAHIGAHNNLMASGNEFTFASSGFSGMILLNYRTAGGTNGNITGYEFCNGKGASLGIAIHTGNYSSYALSLSGGTMTGSIKFNANSLPEKTLSYVCGIDAFASGGEMGWMGGSSFVAQFAPTLTGTGASGTWGISITGNAATATTATNADTVDNYHASGLAKFYLSPMETDAPASSAKSWFINTMPSGAGAIVYNVPGSEKTIIVGKSTGLYGHMLMIGYDDNYLRLLRFQNNKWLTDDWEKISAGYADNAGNADTLDGVHNGEVTAQYFSAGTILTHNDSINRILSGVYSYVNADNPTGYIGDNCILVAFRNQGRTDNLQIVGAGNEQALYYRIATNIGNSYENWTEWRELIHSGNIGSQSVKYADMLGGYHATCGSNTPWGTIPVITTEGWMDVGKQFEFHYDNTTGSDYSTVLRCTGNHGNKVELPSSSGTLALLTDNVATATKLQTPRTIWGQSFDGTANVSGDLTGVGSITRATIGSVDTDSCGNLKFQRLNSVASDYWTVFLANGTSVFAVHNNGNVGIGTNSPTYKLDVNGNIRSNQSIIGYSYSTNGNAAAFVWDKPGGYQTGVGSNGTEDTIRFSACTMDGTWVDYTQNWKFYGNIAATGAVTAKASSSDIRLKTDITDYKALSIIRSHKSIKYHWNEVAKANADIFNDDYWHYGLIAQDVQKDMPQIVSDVFKDYLVINYERLIPICWKGLQEVDDEVTKLKKRVKQLERRLLKYESTEVFYTKGND